MSTATASPSASQSLKTNAIQPVLIDGEWRKSASTGTFTATNPQMRKPLEEVFPISGWSDIDMALAAASAAASAVRAMPDAATKIACFLEDYASRIEGNAGVLAAAASSETALPVTPRLSNVELPRTTNQLRLAATAAREGSWCRPTIDTKAAIRSCMAPIGPVWTVGPNNFPFAYNGICGGDFAAAIAAGNPVLAKAHPLHPNTSRLLAEAAHLAAKSAELPDGIVQMLYHMTPGDGLRLVADPRLKAIAFTGSRKAGLSLKSAADATGKLFFAEMSSINPVVILPGALIKNSNSIADQFTASVLLGAGQFCTKPGIVLMMSGAWTETFIAATAGKFASAPAGTLFSEAGESSLTAAINTIRSAGAELITGGTAKTDGGFGLSNSLLRISAARYLANPQTCQTEAFGNASLIVVADDLHQLKAVLNSLEGNLTGTIYSAVDGTDDAIYREISAILRPKVGRLLNDKMPTGVAVSPAMNHGGPFPATTQPHFTAVGFPAAILRFTQLESYDNVRPDRLPACLINKNPTGTLWRMIDGIQTQADI